MIAILGVREIGAIGIRCIAITTSTSTAIIPTMVIATIIPTITITGTTQIQVIPTGIPDQAQAGNKTQLFHAKRAPAG